jgi:exoribonuclease-2
VAQQHILFEEDGAFRAGSVLSATDSALQVELASGKRVKVKAGHVLLRYEAPAPAELLTCAQACAETIDLDFLWECAPQDEFAFIDLAREYHGHTPNAVEATSILMRLHGAPVYFHRKGRGRYRPAPAEILKAALAAVERKRLQETQRQQMVDALIAGELPPAIAQQAVTLLVRPDKNGIEYKALEQAASALHVSPLRLLLQRGAIASPYYWHHDSFLAMAFPRGPGFAADLPPPPTLSDLPLAAVAAFSIDDSSTTEIDDAFSVQWRDAGVTIGIHIAAPALAIGRDHALDGVARSRMSTVYAPGLKYTMLPEAWIAAYSLDAGREAPVLSLYADIEPASGTVVALRTQAERVPIVANLRHDELDALVDDASLAAGLPGVPHARELIVLHRVALALLEERERVRGRPEPRNRVDYTFELDGTPPEATVTIRRRRRGAPLDLIVAELMILANSHWGGWLAERRTPGIYRSQSLGRVRMSTTPAAHDGIGVAQYAWCTSPLRRYVDLVNQRQLLALAQQAPAPYAAQDADLFAIVSGFDSAYTMYAEFQGRLERYWCLRWLEKQGINRIAASVLKDELVRLEGLPFVMRLPGIPSLARGTRIELDIVGHDELELSLSARFRGVLAGTVSDEVLAAEADALDEAVESAAAPETGSIPDAAPVAAPQASAEPMLKDAGEPSSA